MTTYEILSITGLYIGLGLIWYGLRQMAQASARRDKEIDNQRLALETLIERTAR